MPSWSVDWSGLGLVLSLGSAWVSLHCAGMCGPLIAGLRIGHLGSATVGTRLRIVTQVVAYQAGRGLVLAAAGALAGWCGGAVATLLQDGQLWCGVILAALFFAIALRRLGVRLSIRGAGRAVPGGAAPNAGAGPLARLLQLLPAGLARHSHLAAAALGAVMALLPCGIVLWTLGLAAASAAPVQGALLMALLVMLTTPVLLGSAALAGAVSRAAPPSWRAAWRGWTGRWLPAAALAFSGSWILALAVLRSAGAVCHHPGAG